MKKFPFHFNGISVIVPDLRLIAINKGVENPEIIRQESDGFTPIRIVGNICLYNNNDRDQPIKNFGQPVEFRVGYTFYDVMQCEGDINNLKLAYWDGKQWVVVSNPEHEFQVFPPSTGQIAEFKITEWVGDPAIAWGR